MAAPAAAVPAPPAPVPAPAGGAPAAPGAGPSVPPAKVLTPEVWFDPKKEEELEKKEAQDRLEIRALPVRQYLEKSVVPLLLSGLQLLAIERPENPVEYLAKYLIKENPRKPPPTKKEEKKEEMKEEKKEEKKEG